MNVYRNSYTLHFRITCKIESIVQKLNQIYKRHPKIGAPIEYSLILKHRKLDNIRGIRYHRILLNDHDFAEVLIDDLSTMCKCM